MWAVLIEEGSCIALKGQCHGWICESECRLQLRCYFVFIERVSRFCGTFRIHAQNAVFVFRQIRNHRSCRFRNAVDTILFQIRLDAFGTHVERRVAGRECSRKPCRVAVQADFPRWEFISVRSRKCD